MFKKVPKIFRNFYVVSLAIFFAWMLILENNNLVARYQLGAKLKSLEDEKEYYQEKIKEVQKDRAELFGDKESIEKFAREKYLMKKEKEDIYVIVEEE
jgi:cell division protein FtsB